MPAISTPDLTDAHPEARAIELQFASFGAIARFHGPAVTIKCHEDNSLVKQCVAEPGAGRVIVVDGGGSLRRALLGDMLAEQAAANGWAGGAIPALIEFSAPALLFVVTVLVVTTTEFGRILRDRSDEYTRAVLASRASSFR